MKASEIMKKQVVVCEPNATVEEVCILMEKENVGCVPVIDSAATRRIEGIITDRDIVCRVIARGGSPIHVRAKDCMTTSPITIDADASIAECCRTMEQYKIRRVPVIDRNERCIGIVADADVATHTPKSNAGELLRRVTERSKKNERREVMER